MKKTEKFSYLVTIMWFNFIVLLCILVILWFSRFFSLSLFANKSRNLTTHTHTHIATLVYCDEKNGKKFAYNCIHNDIYIRIKAKVRDTEKKVEKENLHRFTIHKESSSIEGGKKSLSSYKKKDIPYIIIANRNDYFHFFFSRLLHHTHKHNSMLV